MSRGALEVETDPYLRVMQLAPNGNEDAEFAANVLTEEEVKVVSDFIQRMGGDYSKVEYHLYLLRYTVYTWLGHRIIDSRKAKDNERYCTQGLVHAFYQANGVPSKWVEYLRTLQPYSDFSHIELPVK